MIRTTAESRRRGFGLIAGVGLAVLASPAAAQLSEYIVFSGDQGTFSVIRDGQLIRSWSVAPNSAKYQYPLAINGTIRTMGANQGDDGAEYDLSGGDLGARYTHPVGQSRCWDGTTNGTENFAIDTGGTVARYDADWTSPTILFSAGSIGAVTYDPTNNSLWVSQFSGTTTVIEYDMRGTVLRSIDVGHERNMALALDYADGTLWLHDRGMQGTFEQWTKEGVLLTRRNIAGMEGQNALAGEFQFAQPCYADCDTSTGVGVLDLFDFLCFQNSFVNGETYACDCDTTTGPLVCDVSDFLCFQNAFVGGCP